MSYDARQFRIACAGALSRLGTCNRSRIKNHSEAPAEHTAHVAICCSTSSLPSGDSRPSANSIKDSIVGCRIKASSYVTKTASSAVFEVFVRTVSESAQCSPPAYRVHQQFLHTCIADRTCTSFE